MKLKHKGRAVKVVKITNPCTDCIFFKWSRCSLSDANDFEIKNKLKDCEDVNVKYIYA